MKKLNFFSCLFLFLAFSNAVLAQVTTTTIVSNTTWSAAVNNQNLGLSSPSTAATVWAINSATNPTITGGWQPAVVASISTGQPVITAGGALPIGRVANEDDGRAAYFRRSFTLNGCIQSATLAFNADDMSRVYINGIQVFNPSPLTSTMSFGLPSIIPNTLSTNNWTTTPIFNIAPFLVVGNNTIAVELINYKYYCHFSLAATINTAPLPVVAITGTTTICPNTSTTLTASGGGTYKWSTGATAAAISTAAAGTYTVTVTNSAGCTAVASTTVVVSSPPLVFLTGATTVCSGASTTLTASGGGTYKWSTGATTAAISTATAGTYTVTVTSSAGCTAVASATVVVNSPPLVSITGATTVCEGSCTTLTALGGGTYQWSTGATTAAISPCPTVNTTYTVTVTNTAGCKTVASKLVTVNPKPVLTLSASNPKICKGEKADLKVISTTPCASTYTVLWSTGQTTQTITVTPAVTTTYSCTVTCPATGCSSVGSITVYVYPSAFINLISQSVKCNGPIAVVSLDIEVYGGTAPYTYLWSNGATTQDLVSVSGTATSYCVTVTDANGCKTIKCFDCMNPCVANQGLINNGAAKVSKENGNENVVISHEAITDFKVYPNPFENDINVEWAAQKSSTTENEKMTINIYNATGQLVKSQIVDDRDLSSKIQMTTLPLGLYNVVIESAGKVLSTTKVIKD